MHVVIIFLSPSPPPCPPLLMQWGVDLSGEHEQFLVAHCGQLPVFVTDFPAVIKPFYAKQNHTSDRQTVSNKRTCHVGCLAV